MDYRVMALLCQLDNGQNRSLFCVYVKVPTMTIFPLKSAFRLFFLDRPQNQIQNQLCSEPLVISLTTW